MGWGIPSPARFLASRGNVLPGAHALVQVPNPAAAADWNVTVPGGEQWYLSTAFALFTASATVASRVPGLTFSVNGVVVYQTGGYFTITASNIGQFSFTPDVQSTGRTVAGVACTLATPKTWLPAGAQISSLTLSIAAGDQWSNIALFVERVYVENDQLTVREVEQREENAAAWAALEQYAGA